MLLIIDHTNSGSLGLETTTVLIRTVVVWDFAPVVWGIRIQPTFALVRVVKGDKPMDINCPIPPACCMHGHLACSEAYEFGQLGTGLSWFR